MIILHYAIPTNSITTVHGYAFHENGETFILQEDGIRIRVRPETVMPYRTCRRLEDYISLTGRMLERFHAKGIYSLEDIEERGDKGLEEIRGIGAVRKKAIREVMERTLGESGTI